jgi:hypothetical protein
MVRTWIPSTKSEKIRGQVSRIHGVGGKSAKSRSISGNNGGQESASSHRNDGNDSSFRYPKHSRDLRWRLTLEIVHRQDESLLLGQTRKEFGEGLLRHGLEGTSRNFLLKSHFWIIQPWFLGGRYLLIQQTDLAGGNCRRDIWTPVN